MTDATTARAGGSWRARTIEALGSISEAVYILDAEDRVTWVNTAAERVLERSAEELVGRHVFAEFPRLGSTPLAEAHRRARAEGQSQHLEVFNKAVDRWFEVRVHPNGQSLVVFFRDVHDRRTLDEERAAETSLIRAVLNALPSRTAILDGDGTILTTNTAWARGTAAEGRPFASRAGANYLKAVRAAGDAGDPDARAAVRGLEDVLARRAPSYSLDYAVHRAGHRAEGLTWWNMQAFPVDEGPRIVVTHTDITDRVTAEQRAAWQARHDHLTALPNRAGLHEAISAALAEDVGGRVTVLYMDVDGFKQVNDSLGHDAGDLLLRELASRLSHRTRPTDVVGRLGGDEFVVVARDCDASGGQALATRFRSVFDEPFELAGTRLPVTVSIGIASSDPAHTRPEDLLRDADAAMYAAKASGPANALSFTPALRTVLAERWQIASRLRDAAELGQLDLHWQPVVAATGGEVLGCEALLRWHHPDRGLIGPAEFIPVAEENGLVVPITRWLLDAALGQATAWAAEGLELTVGVNVSAVHLSTGTLVDDVLGALTRHGVAAGSLVLELTETALAHATQAREQLSALRARGVRVAIDDFGSGYSSLAAVASLPADMLKVDRGLVSGMLPAGPAVLRAITALGSALGMEVLAEGVETAEQLALVQEAGCTHVQGHHLSPPLPAGELAALLIAHQQPPGRPHLP